MKTWTNPTVEELEVKLTANGLIDNDVENVGDALDKYIGDYNWGYWEGADWVWFNDSLKKDTEKTQS